MFCALYCVRVSRVVFFEDTLFLVFFFHHIYSKKKNETVERLLHLQLPLKKIATPSEKNCSLFFRPRFFFRKSVQKSWEEKLLCQIRQQSLGVAVLRVYVAVGQQAWLPSAAA